MKGTWAMQHATRARPMVSAAVVMLVLAAAPVHTESATAATDDALSAGFREPPNSARPRVWWHWMNGNVTRDGIEKDLAWMKRIGLGGLQNFDASLATPQIVEQRLVYMSPQWQDAFRFAVERADALGLEYGIAASPGWTETGGPWVQPQQAMKKLVWSETILAGGKRLNEPLPLPPTITGPFMSIGRASHANEPNVPATFYADAAVIAYRVEPQPVLPHPTAITSNGAPVDATVLTDKDLTTGAPLPGNTQNGPGVIEFDYAQPQTIRSATLFIANLPARSIAGPLVPRLEAYDGKVGDGHEWRKITDLGLTKVPTTVSFAPVTAAKFRFVFARGKRPDTSSFAPARGVDLSAATGIGGSSSATPQVVDLQLLAEPRVNAFEQKAGFALADNYYALDDAVGADMTGVPPNAVIDLTSHMTAEGRLNWTPPRGRWKVLRLGYSLTGAINRPATPETTGLEVDKYDGAAVESYLTTYLNRYREVVGDALMGAQGLSSIVTDSTEVGPSNWTPRLLEQFQRLRGYDPRPWLPTLTGEIIGSRRQSDAFLYDFRRTLADLTSTEHYGTIARVAHAQGLTVYGESLEGGRATLGDDLEMRRFADIPMGALWTYGKRPAPEYVADLRGAASTAHLYGRTCVAAESLTSILNPWAFAPAELQPMIDAEFAHGVNRPMLHSTVHQPVDDKVPGLSLQAFGQYFNRHETWAEMAKPWIDYIARNSYLLQQGHNVADVAYFYGEEAPLGQQALNNGYPTDVPTHYAYDFVSADAVLNELSVNDNELTAKHGARYQAIYLGGLSHRMTLAVLQRLAEFAAAGATIVGDAPQSSPSLADDPQQFAQLVQRLWGGGKLTNVGTGRVIAGHDIEGALAAIGVAPDFNYASPQPDSELQFVHRRIDSGDIYFVANRVKRAEHIEARFRVTGKVPEIWHADTGAVEAVSYRIEDGVTIVPLEMLPQESLFVVFTKPAATTSATVTPPAFTTAAELTGAWDVAFQPGRGAPAATRLESLASLSDHTEPGIRYFSGVATYTKRFTLPKGIKKGAPLFIDLGRIGDVAEVRVNNKLAGTVWKAPYRLDISALVRSGTNTLDVRVANLWVNRLIGDAQPDAHKITFTTQPTYTAKAPLRPGGLIGPVVLMQAVH